MIFLLMASLGTPYGGEAFNIGLGARALGMGEAYSALARDPSGVFWNPGGLSLAEGTGILAMHGAYLQGLSYEFASVSREGILGSFSGGLGVYFLNAGDIKRTQLPDTTLPPGDDNAPEITGTTSYRAYALLLSLANSWGLGFTLRTLGQNADTLSGYGLGLDIGYLREFRSFSLGLVLRNATTTPIFWSSGTHETVSPSLVVGTALEPASWLTLSGEGVLEEWAGADAFFLGPVGLNPRMGAELRLGPASFRAGWQGEGMSAGAGFKAGSFSGDYALLFHGDLGAAHRFSLGVSF